VRNERAVTKGPAKHSGSTGTESSDGVIHPVARTTVPQVVSGLGELAYPSATST
jgi:hypothetical protein